VLGLAANNKQVTATSEPGPELFRDELAGFGVTLVLLVRDN
jgi:hypothetical protein